jgi:hypothetical protein
MLVGITKATGQAWWDNHIGEVFEVREANKHDGLFNLGTHYILMHPRGMNYAISKDCCEIVNIINNKGASHLLSKEENI